MTRARLLLRVLEVLGIGIAGGAASGTTALLFFSLLDLPFDEAFRKSVADGGILQLVTFVPYGAVVGTVVGAIVFPATYFLLLRKQRPLTIAPRTYLVASLGGVVGLAMANNRWFQTHEVLGVPASYYAIVMTPSILVLFGALVIRRRRAVEPTAARNV